MTANPYQSTTVDEPSTAGTSIARGLAGAVVGGGVGAVIGSIPVMLGSEDLQPTIGVAALFALAAFASCTAPGPRNMVRSVMVVGVLGLLSLWISLPIAKMLGYQPALHRLDLERHAERYWAVAVALTTASTIGWTAFLVRWRTRVTERGEQ